MQKKSVANLLLGKSANANRMFVVAVPKANFHSSKTANVEVNHYPMSKVLKLMK